MTPLVMKCPSCLIEVPADSRFCLSCGQVLSSLSQMPTAGVQPTESDPRPRTGWFCPARLPPANSRQYDIAEFEGQHFLSTEYIDGEDLRSLIKRIGYISNEKALQLTRQLVAGVAAAHERGVLHRDLKPANIMIDGHGRARITDFGLAVFSTEETISTDVFGTPAYVAPEQFAGKPATVRSDIYSLGLVLYEIYCGKPAFSAESLLELRQQKETQTPPAPSGIREGIDTVVERLIMRCLERDPQGRPASAAQLAAALPGGDPLAAALAAGETPSPEMVAASGLKEGLRPVAAFGLIILLLGATLATMALKRDALDRIPKAK
jgi:serine/threonine protein kinase